VAIEVSLYRDEEEEKCYWRVACDALYIDELFEIGDPPLQSCRWPNLVIDVPFTECTGIVRITRHTQSPLPLLKPADECINTANFCNCPCAAETICVEETIDGRPMTYEATWDEDQLGWVREDGFVYELEWDEYIGLCFFKPGGAWERQELGDCGSFAVVAEDANGNTFYAESKDCGCSQPCCLMPLPENLSLTYENVSGCPDIDGVTEVLTYSQDLRWTDQGYLPVVCRPPYGEPPERRISASVLCGGESAVWSMNTSSSNCGFDGIAWEVNEEESSCDPFLIVFDGETTITDCGCCMGPIEVRAVLTE
jgi:hypothetical protein